VCLCTCMTLLLKKLLKSTADGEFSLEGLHPSRKSSNISEMLVFQRKSVNFVKGL
jgi:hypothetical protein